MKSEMVEALSTFSIRPQDKFRTEVMNALKPK